MRGRFIRDSSTVLVTPLLALVISRAPACPAAAGEVPLAKCIPPGPSKAPEARQRWVSRPTTGYRPSLGHPVALQDAPHLSEGGEVAKRARVPSTSPARAGVPPVRGSPRGDGPPSDGPPVDCNPNKPLSLLSFRSISCRSRVRACTKVWQKPSQRKPGGPESGLLMNGAGRRTFIVRPAITVPV